MALNLMYITNDPDVALIAEKHGVDRIWIDLETLGKEERQKADTVKSHHSVQDIALLSQFIKKAEILVRVNPWNRDSVREINDVIAAGGQSIMLPMWKTVDEVKSFIATIRNRAKVILLLETKEAVECLDAVLQLPGIDEIHIGLNDLHLSYGLTFMFELLSNGVVETLCEKIRSFGIPYGFGGIAKIGTGQLPAELVLAEHVRLGSSMVILARAFCNTQTTSDLRQIEHVFCEELKKLRAKEEELRQMDKEFFNANKREIAKIIDAIVSERLKQ